MKKSLFLSLLLVSMLLFSGCGGDKNGGGGKDTNGGGSAGQGSLVFEIANNPSQWDFQKVEVTISNLEVFKGEVEDPNGEWVSVLKEPKTFDLMAVKEANALLGSGDVPAGRYTMVSFMLDKAVATKNGQSIELSVPLPKVTVIRRFEVNAGDTTKLVLNFADRYFIVEIPGGYVAKTGGTIKVLQ